MTTPPSYFDYLRSRGRLGLAYRRAYLYPRLSRHLRGRTLDVGCGIGDFLDFRSNTVGLDVDSDNVGYCRARGHDVHLVEGDRYPFADQTFDSAILDNVLEHIVEWRPVLLEVRRVLKAGAPLLVGVPGRRGYASDPDHKVFYDEPTLIATMEAVDLHVQRILYMPVRAKWLDRYLRQYCLYGVFSSVRQSS